MSEPNAADMARHNAQARSDAAARLLAEPFDEKEVRFKPGVVKGNRALAMPYVDVRSIQDRLDKVVGIQGWSDRYVALPNGSVMCELSVKFGEEWVTKTDVGSPSEQPDEGDRLKAAFSDALKRAAVKFGIARYLYRNPAKWWDYDPQSRQFRVKPVLSGAPAQPSKPAPQATTAQKPPAAKPKDDEGITEEKARRLHKAAEAARCVMNTLWNELRISRWGELKNGQVDAAYNVIQAVGLCCTGGIDLSGVKDEYSLNHLIDMDSAKWPLVLKTLRSIHEQRTSQQGANVEQG